MKLLGVSRPGSCLTCAGPALEECCPEGPAAGDREGAFWAEGTLVGAFGEFSVGSGGAGSQGKWARWDWLRWDCQV